MNELVHDLGSTPGASEAEWRLKNFVLLVIAKVVVTLVVDSVVDSLVQNFPDEPSNMFSLLASEVSHLPQSTCAKDDAL